MIKYINYLLFYSLLSLCSCKEITKPTKPSEDFSKKNKETTIIPQKTPEEILRETLNNEEQANLNFLKQALNNEEKFNKFLLCDQSKIKEALDHIKTQLESCKDNDEGKKTFKDLVTAYFDTMDDNKLANFKQHVLSVCQ
ncbi:Mlp family lipoprotein [Borrelia persica]|uniref:Mlp family lipoprotein n=1 Tax=Borrelia persica TaxID=44448 RepID=UPI0004ACA74F|nr:Mlp family lipoprotein [Borrelia persica]